MRVTGVVCDGYPGHRTAVVLRATVEQLVDLRPLQLGPLCDLTVQAALVGPHNFALEHRHVAQQGVRTHGNGELDSRNSWV